jgi:hypothetical protein
LLSSQAWISEEPRSAGTASPCSSTGCSEGGFRCPRVQAELLPFLRRIYRRMVVTGDTAEAVMIVQQ